MAIFRVAKGTTDYGTGGTGALFGVANTDSVFHHEGNQTVSSNIGTGGYLGSLTAGPANYYIDSDSSVSVGGSSGPLYVCATTLLTYAAAQGEFYWSSYANGAAAATARAKMLSPGRMFVQGGTVTQLECANGYTEVGTSAVTTTLYQTGGATSHLYNATAITLARISAGSAAIQRSLTTMVISGSAQVQVYREDTQAAGSNPVATTIDVVGGRLDWRGGAITTLRVEGNGQVDFSTCPASCTVGTLLISRYAMSRSILRSRVPGVVITYSSATVEGGDDDNIRGM